MKRNCLLIPLVFVPLCLAFHLSARTMHLGTIKVLTYKVNGITPEYTEDSSLMLTAEINRPVKPPLRVISITLTAALLDQVQDKAAWKNLVVSDFTEPDFICQVLEDDQYQFIFYEVASRVHTFTGAYALSLHYRVQQHVISTTYKTPTFKTCRHTTLVFWVDMARYARYIRKHPCTSEPPVERTGTAAWSSTINSPIMSGIRSPASPWLT